MCCRKLCSSKGKCCKEKADDDASEKSDNEGKIISSPPKDTLEELNKRNSTVQAGDAAKNGSDIEG